MIRSMGRTFGYARPTPTMPDPADHFRELSAAGATEIYVEKKAAAARRGMLERQRLLRDLASGDTLILAQLGHLGTTLEEVMRLLELLMDREVTVRVLASGFDTGSASLPAYRELLGLLIATRSALHSEIVKGRLAATRAKGGKAGGNPTALAEAQWPDIKERLTTAKISDVAEDVGVSRQTLWKFRRKMEALDRASEPATRRRSSGGLATSTR